MMMCIFLSLDDKRSFSHHVTVVMLVYKKHLNSGHVDTVPKYPVGIELFSSKYFLVPRNLHSHSMIT